MKYSRLSILILCLLAYTIGMKLGASSWRGIVVLTSTGGQIDGRVPAAIGKVFDVSSYSGTELVAASQQRVLRAARIIRRDGDVGLVLGHFITRDEIGQKLLACQFYDWVEVTLEAQGVAVSGHRPSILIEGPCAIDDDVNYLAPLWIPVEQIKGQVPSDLEVSFDDATGTRVKIEHVDTLGVNKQWPKRWAVTSIRLYHRSDSGRELKVEGKQLAKILPGTFLLEW